jgi:hypothetical protein
MTTMIVEDLGRIPMSPFLTATLTRAADYAAAQQHREVTLEHLLLALAEDPEATVVLKSSNIDLNQLTAEVSDFLGRSDDRIDPASGQPIAISADLRRILEAAAAAARQGRRREINGAIVLAAIVGDGKSTAAHLLRLQGLTFEEAIRALQRATPSPQRLEPDPPPPQPPQPPIDFGEPPKPDLTRPATPATPQPPPTTEEILASARERLQNRTPAEQPVEAAPPQPAPAPLPRANYPDLGGPPPRPVAAPAPPAAPPSYDYGPELPVPAARAPGAVGHGDELEIPSYLRKRQGGPDAGNRWEPPPQPVPPGPYSQTPQPIEPEPPSAPAQAPASSRFGRPVAPPQDVPRTGPPPQADRRRAGSGPFVGSWPLIEAGQLVENIPRRMRVGVPVVVEARIARADVKALAEGLQGGGAAYRHEVVVTKAMSVRLRAPDGGFSIENRSPETQWIENVLGLGNDDYASWRWTVTPRARGSRQLQLIVSARTVGADGMTAETALPDQLVDVRVAINYARTFGKWVGWILAAVIGGALAKFGETGWVIAKLLIAKHLGG